jgi:hypothetical protein
MTADIPSAIESTMFNLDDEQRSRIGDCLRKDAIALDRDGKERLARNIELTISAFLEAKLKAGGTLRDAHEALRQLWFLAHEKDVPVRQLRTQLNHLPRRAVEYLDLRAEHVIPSLFPGEAADHGFLAWAQSAVGEKLVQAVCVVSSEGGQRVSRSRGGGKRSRPRVEPRIFGQVRGASGDLKGGRPTHDAQDKLVMHLALDWSIVTEVGLCPGRSDHTGFGDLVHSVFQWLEEPSAEQALRRFWERVEAGRPSLEEGSKPR